MSKTVDYRFGQCPKPINGDTDRSATSKILHTICKIYKKPFFIVMCRKTNTEEKPWHLSFGNSAQDKNNLRKSRFEFSYNSYQKYRNTSCSMFFSRICDFRPSKRAIVSRINKMISGVYRVNINECPICHITNFSYRNAKD